MTKTVSQICHTFYLQKFCKEMQFNFFCWELIKIIFCNVIVIFSFNVIFSCNTLKCVSINNQECKVRPEIININSNEPSFYPYSVKISKCSGNCNDTNDLYAKLCASCF